MISNDPMRGPLPSFLGHSNRTALLPQAPAPHASQLQSPKLLTSGSLRTRPRIFFLFLPARGPWQGSAGPSNSPRKSSEAFGHPFNLARKVQLIKSKPHAHATPHASHSTNRVRSHANPGASQGSRRWFGAAAAAPRRARAPWRPPTQPASERASKRRFGEAVGTRPERGQG